MGVVFAGVSQSLSNQYLSYYHSKETFFTYSIEVRYCFTMNYQHMTQTVGCKQGTAGESIKSIKSFSNTVNIVSLQRNN